MTYQENFLSSTSRPDSSRPIRTVPAYNVNRGCPDDVWPVVINLVF